LPFFAAGERDLSLHRLQQVQFLQLLAEGLRAHELRLVVAQELEHVLQVLRLVSLLVEQTLAPSLAIAARPVLVDAQRELVGFFTLSENERITPHEGWNIVGLPGVVLVEVQILGIRDSQHNHGSDSFLTAREDDRVLASRQRDLDGRQRNRVHLGGKAEVNSLDAQIAVKLRGHRDNLVVKQHLRHSEKSPFPSGGT